MSGTAQVGGQGLDRLDQRVADVFGTAAVGQAQEHDVAGGAFDEGADR